MLAPFVLAAALALQAPDTAHVILVATTDIHGHVVDWDYLRNQPFPGGLARVATVVDSLRNRYPDEVVLVDAGDLIQGDPFATYYSSVAPRDPHPVLDAMNAVGYDAATPGNHEFNFGLAFMDRALAAAHFPYVSGNLRVPPRDTLALHAYTVVLRHGVRIGIGGFTTPGVMVWDGDKLAGRMRVARIESSAGAVLREMRQDADLLVVLIHSGMDGPSSYDTTGVGAENVAARLTGEPIRPDIVVVGHSHREMADSVINGVHFVQPAPFAQSISVVHVDLEHQGEGWRPVRIRGELVSLAHVPAAVRILRRLSDEHNTVLTWMAQPLGDAVGRMKAATSRVEDTPIIQFINDVQRRRAHADLSATTVFDLRGGFDDGEVTIGHIVALYPFDNTLRAIRISGERLKAYLEQSARYFYADSTGRIAVNALVPPFNYDIVGGARYQIDLSRPAGDRIRELSVRGRPVEPTDSFTLALDSYRQAGGGNFAMLKGARVVYDRRENIRDLLIAEVRARRVMRPDMYPDTLWRIVPAEAARAARALFVRDVPASRPDSVPVALHPARPDSARLDSLDRERRRADSTANAVVATLRLPLMRDQGGLGLGALAADAYRNALRADFAIVHQDELVEDLGAGPVTNAMVKALQPTPRRLLRITLSGEDLRWVMEHLVEGEAPCCYLSGGRVTFKSGGPEYHRLKEIRLPNGRKLDRRAVYTLAISERLISGRAFILGPSDCAAPTGCARSGMLERWQVDSRATTSLDALFTYLARLPQPVAPPADPRVVPVK